MATPLEAVALAIAIAGPERITTMDTKVPANLIRELRRVLAERYDLDRARREDYRGPVRWYGDEVPHDG